MADSCCESACGSEAVKADPAIRKVIPHVLVSQTKFLKQDARAVGAESATVEADVEEPIIFVVRLL